MPALRWAEESLPALEAIRDYSATLVKRERVDGVVGEYQYLALKIRNKPFSVYAEFLAPESLRGQEVIYVEGQNNGNMWAHRPNNHSGLLGVVSVTPQSAVAMQGQRYPLTEIGIVNMIRRLIEVAKQDVQYGECEVKFIKGAKINGRVCTVVQVVHPVPRKEFRFHLARIFVDDELKLPIRFESYDWPTQPDGEPRLLEEYTYLNLQLNRGFTDLDFSTQNPEYRFYNRTSEQASR